MLISKLQQQNTERERGRTDEVPEGETDAGHNALNLMELGQVGGVQRFVAEHAVDAEQLHRLELPGRARLCLKHPALFTQVPRQARTLPRTLFRTPVESF